MARLSAALGGGTALLAVGWLACALAGALAAHLGAALRPGLASEARSLLVAFALLLAAAELIVLRPGRTPVEPTRSFGAVLLVLGTAQLTAAAGLLVLALAAATGKPWLAASGGVLGSGAVFTAAWSMAEEWEGRLPLAALRYGAAGLMAVAAAGTVLAARGLL